MTDFSSICSNLLPSLQGLGLELDSPLEQRLASAWRVLEGQGVGQVVARWRRGQEGGLARAGQLREEATALYREGRLEEAAALYRRGLVCLPPSAWREEGGRGEVVLGLANLSTVLWDQERWKEARTAASLLLASGGEGLEAGLRRRLHKRVKQCR